MVKLRFRRLRTRIIITTHLTSVLFHRLGAMRPAQHRRFGLTLRTRQLQLLFIISVRTISRQMNRNRVFKINRIQAQQTRLSTKVNFQPFQLGASSTFITRNSQLPFRTVKGRRHIKGIRIRQRRQLRVNRMIKTKVFIRRGRTISMNISRHLQIKMILRRHRRIFTMFNLRQLNIRFRLHTFRRRRQTTRLNSNILRFQILGNVR